MQWFFIALIAPIFWSINVHFDRFILTKYGRRGGVGSVFLFSTFFSFLFAFLVLILKYKEIFLYSNFQSTFFFLFPGFLNALGFYFYLQSLKDEESSVTVALFQLSPVFAYFLSYLILGEVLTTHQILASLLILSGVSILSVDLQENNIVFAKKRVLFFIALSALFFALNDVLFKGFTINDGSFATSLFWQHIGIFTTGLCFFLFFKSYRQDFFYLIKKGRTTLFLLNGISELFYVLGNLLSNLATLFASVALVLVVNSYQVVFTFALGIIFTLFLPNLVNEKISLRHLLHKSLAIITIIAGSCLLYLS